LEKGRGPGDRNMKAFGRGRTAGDVEGRLKHRWEPENWEITPGEARKHR
jgi:hypothetical protein